MSAARPTQGGLKGRHVLYALLGFFGVMLIANAIFVYYAVATFGGGDTSSPYQKGLRYNQTIAEAAKQVERGWSAKLTYRHGRIFLDLRDRQDQPVRGMRLDGNVGRPTTDRQDVRVELQENEPGSYSGLVELGAGQWVVQLHSDDLTSSGDPAYRLKQRLYVEALP